MTLQEKTLKIVRRLLVLTTEKSCTWKYERLLINDNHQALFFDSFKTELKSGLTFFAVPNSLKREN